MSGIVSSCRVGTRSRSAAQAAGRVHLVERSARVLRDQVRTGFSPRLANATAIQVTHSAQRVRPLRASTAPQAADNHTCGIRGNPDTHRVTPAQAYDSGDEAEAAHHSGTHHVRPTGLPRVAPPTLHEPGSALSLETRPQLFTLPAEGRGRPPSPRSCSLPTHRFELMSWQQSLEVRVRPAGNVSRSLHFLHVVLRRDLPHPVTFPFPHRHCRTHRTAGGPRGG